MQDQSTTATAAPPDANPIAYTPRCTPALIDSAQADAIEALQAILNETAPLDIFDDLPERTQPNETTDTTSAPDAPRRHSPRGRALRLSIRLRAATALLRIKTHAAQTPSSRSPNPQSPSPADNNSGTGSSTRRRSTSSSPNPQSEIRNPKSHRSADTNDPEDSDDAPEPRRQSPPRSALSIARTKAEARKAESDRLIASIYAGNLKAYENYLEVVRQAELRHAQHTAAATTPTNPTNAPPTAHDPTPATNSALTHHDDPPT